jgi:hypothetical protein
MKDPTISQMLPQPAPGSTCFEVKRELFTRILRDRKRRPGFLFRIGLASLPYVELFCR